MAGRPWGPVKSGDPATRDAVLWLRGLIERSGKTVRDVAEACGCKPATVSTRLNGSKPPSPEFGDQVIEACAPRATWPAKKAEFRKLLNRPRAPAPALVVPDARTRVLDAQAETAQAQAQTIRVLDELSRTKDQLLAGIRLEFQAAHVITALRKVLVRLIGIGGPAASEREWARNCLEQAKAERDRAERLAERAQEVLDALGARFAAPEMPPAEPIITPDGVLVDVTAGLTNVQQFLDEQDAQLSRWEGGISAADAAARLRAQYVDAPVAVAILDADDAFLWTNRLFLELVKYSSEELASMRWTDVVRGWTDRDDHMLLCGNKELLNCKVDRWPVSGFQVALVHELYDSEQFGARSLAWLNFWFTSVGGFDSEKIGALRIRFEINCPDEELETENYRMIFRLVSPGRVVVSLGEDAYLLVFDGRVTNLPDIIQDVRRLFENSGKVSFEAAVAPFAFRKNSPEELLWQVETSARWAEAVRGDRLWTVADPCFPETEPRPREPLRCQPMVDEFRKVARLRVLNAISPEVFGGAVDQLRQWEADESLAYVPDLEFDVTAEDLRASDWRKHLPQRKSGPSVHLVLGELRDFETYALLRRFEYRGGVAVRSVRIGSGVRSALGVPYPGTDGMEALPPTDAAGIEKLLRHRR